MNEQTNYLPGEGLDNLAHLGVCVLVRVTRTSTLLQAIANPKSAHRKNSRPWMGLMVARQDMFLYLIQVLTLKSVRIQEVLGQKLPNVAQAAREVSIKNIETLRAVSQYFTFLPEVPLPVG